MIAADEMLFGMLELRSDKFGIPLVRIGMLRAMPLPVLFTFVPIRAFAKTVAASEIARIRDSTVLNRPHA
jgi:hypothetical protein